MPRFTLLPAALSAAALLVAFGPLAPADHHADDAPADYGDYRKPTIDVGVIVSDAGAAEAFYEDVLGFEELTEFTVSEQVAGDSGLTNYRSFTAHVMAIGEGEDATRIKLIEMPGRPPARIDNSFVSSSYGPSYLTLHVSDMDPILKAAAENKLKPL
ncbi:MAG: VOC family protein, partial [Planctomycetota bacterium]